MLLVDGGSEGAEVPDVTCQATASRKGCEEAPAPGEEAVAGPTPDAEEVDVDAVLGVARHFPQLLHPLPDEVVHRTLVGLGVHAEEGVDGG
jgi:hypothetical protein